MSSGDSVVVEESAVASTLAEAIIRRDEGVVRVMERRLRRQRDRFHKDIKAERFQAWYNREMKRGLEKEDT